MKDVRRISVCPCEYGYNTITLEYDDGKLTPIGNGSGRILLNGNVIAEFTFNNEMTSRVFKVKEMDLVEQLEAMINRFGEEEN